MSVNMIEAVAEDTITTGKENVLSQGKKNQGRTPEMDQHDHKKKLPFCEPNKSNLNVETASPTFTHVEDTFQDQMNGVPHIDDNSKGNSSYFDLLLTVYLPLIILWLRRSMFGPANLIRTIVVGQLMRLVFVDNISEWMSEKLPPWLEVILFQHSTIKGSTTGPMSTILGAGGGKIDPYAWPPPAFTALALLTIFALVVHPDGLTWIVLGKLRDVTSAIISALGQCLEFILNDYGVFPTIIAATTLAAMFFMVFVVIRTLAPKKANNDSDKHNNTLHNERKKKKKKGGNARHRNNQQRSNRIKFSSRSQSHIVNESENASSVASPCSPMPSPPPTEIPKDTLSSLSLPSKTTVDSPIQVPSLSVSAPSSTIATNIEANERVKYAANDKLPISNGVNKSKDNRSRRRMMSGSTLDTTPLSDDQSCGSTSVRSFPSVSVNSNRSGGGNINKKNNKGSVSTPRRLKRHGTVKSPKNAERNSGKKNRSNTMESPGTSRWDALKPESGNVGKSASNNNTYSHHHANGSTPNKKQNQRHLRGNSRRGHGTNGNGQNRKGRQNQKFVTNEESMIDRDRGVTIPISSTSSSLRVNNVRSSTNEVSPSAATRQQNDCVTWSKTSTANPFANSCTASPQSNSMPPPPPGFRNVFNAHEFDRKNEDLHCLQHHVNNDLLATSLFETPLSIQSLSERRENKVGRASKTIISPQHNVTVISPNFFRSTDSSSGGAMIQENPFRSNIEAISASSIGDNNIVSHYQANRRDSQIEADLQELGGQMAGSILDF